VVNNLNLLRSILDSKQKQLVEVLEQLRTDVRCAKERRAENLFGETGERATASFEFERCLALERQIRKQLDGVEYALRRFEEGQYGLCEQCGQPLDSARLEALPQAKLCLSCKARNTQDRFSSG